MGLQKIIIDVVSIMYCHLWDYDYGVHYHMVHIMSIGKNIGFEIGSMGLRSSVILLGSLQTS